MKGNLVVFIILVSAGLVLPIGLYCIGKPLGARWARRRWGPRDIETTPEENESSIGLLGLSSAPDASLALDDAPSTPVQKPKRYKTLRFTPQGPSIRIVSQGPYKHRNTGAVPKKGCELLSPVMPLNKQNLERVQALEGKEQSRGVKTGKTGNKDGKGIERGK